MLQSYASVHLFVCSNDLFKWLVNSNFKYPLNKTQTNDQYKATTSKIKVTAPLTTEPLTAFPITTEIASDTLPNASGNFPERGDSQNMVKDTTKPPTTTTTTKTVPNTDFSTEPYVMEPGILKKSV